MTTARRYCVIGAGYAGNGVATAFKDADIPYGSRPGSNGAF